jgi:iron complex outermembrane receptor protein
MRVQKVVSWIAVVWALSGWSSPAADAQQLRLAARTPRFLYASSTGEKPVEVDVGRNTVLGRVVSLHVEHATIGGLLGEIQRQTGLTFAYDSTLPASRSVTLEAGSITVAAALGAILAGTDVDVVLTPTGHVWLTEAKARASSVQPGSIAGQVTAKLTGSPIAGATVTLDPARRSATTDADGRYRFADVDTGSYTVRVRYIGYAPLMASVTVGANEGMTVDFALEKSTQQLEEVVTTGTFVPTEIKALPAPVSVINEGDIALQRPHTVQELFRQSVPTAVSWDLPGNPDQTIYSVRGASTLDLGGAQMKVFLDGIEVASADRAPVDPNSIERIEVIRGPQAAAIYGSSAIGGVIQMFTKRGDGHLRRPQIDAQAELGVVQTPYSGFDGVVRQKYVAAVRGGSADVGYSIGGGYSHTGDYVPNGEQSAQSSASVYGGTRFSQGITTIDISGRYLVTNVPNVVNPLLAQTGAIFWSQPRYQPVQNQSQSLGARVGIVPTSWWQAALTLGVDRSTIDIVSSRPRGTTPADTFLQVIRQSQAKSSFGLNTTVRGTLGAAISTSLTAGLDYYQLPADQFSANRALNSTGTILTPPEQPISASRTITSNTGYFAQAQVGLYDALFLTGGLRFERNTGFGDSLGTPTSPRLGISYVRPVGVALVKVRSSWGRAIRAPNPIYKLGAVSGSSTRLANPALGPERQKGWDAGIEAAFGKRASLSLTYFDQTAEDLIQVIFLPTTPESGLVSQYQNVGRVKNTGVEFEGALSVGSVRLSGQYGYVRARVEQLAPGYEGELEVGGQVVAIPKHTAGGSVTFNPLPGTTIVGGLTYVGSWTALDLLGYFGCLGGTTSCRNDTFALDHSYVVEYPAIFKVNVRVVQQLTPLLSGFVTIDNVTNNESYEFLNNATVQGRVATVGMRLQY